MRTVEKEIIKKETVYVALDGTEFKDRNECSKYENSAKCVLYSKYKHLVVKSMCESELFEDVGSDDYTIDVIKIKNNEELDVIKQLHCLYNGNNIGSFNKLINPLNGFIFIGRGYVGEEDDRFFIMYSSEYFTQYWNKLISNQFNK